MQERLYSITKLRILNSWNTVDSRYLELAYLE